MTTGAVAISMHERTGRCTSLHVCVERADKRQHQCSSNIAALQPQSGFVDGPLRLAGVGHERTCIGGCQQRGNYCVIIQPRSLHDHQPVSETLQNGPLHQPLRNAGTTSRHHLHSLLCPAAATQPPFQPLPRPAAPARMHALAASSLACCASRRRTRCAPGVACKADRGVHVVGGQAPCRGAAHVTLHLQHKTHSAQVSKCGLGRRYFLERVQHALRCAGPQTRPAACDHINAARQRSMV